MTGLAPYCVYRITCEVGGKSYIGLTKTGHTKRFRAHCYNSRRGAGGALYSAMRKHGVDAFSVSVVRDGLTLVEAQLLEAETIASLGTRTPKGYNISLGGDAGLAGVVLSKETRAAMSATHTARQADPALRERTSRALKGRVVSEETRAKLRTAMLGKRLTEATKQKLRDANTGKKQGADTIAKRAKALTGRTKSAATRAKMSAAQKGKPKSARHRAALSAALKGVKLSPEVLAKRKAAPHA